MNIKHPTQREVARAKRIRRRWLSGHHSRWWDIGYLHDVKRLPNGHIDFDSFLRKRYPARKLAAICDAPCPFENLLPKVEW